MKKLLFTAVVIAATSLASCGAKCDSTSKGDSTAIADTDSLAADSVVIAASDSIV